MSESNNINKFTATDIEKYWKGELTPSEMHALEKAALDDPFLADALEGYQHTANQAEEIKSLKLQLDERTGKAAKLVSINKKRVPWLRAAAAIVIIGGLGILGSQLFFNKKDKAVAVQEDREKASTSIIPFRDSVADAKIAETGKASSISKELNANTKKQEVKTSIATGTISNALKSDSNTLSDFSQITPSEPATELKLEAKDANAMNRKDSNKNFEQLADFEKKAASDEYYAADKQKTKKESRPMGQGMVINNSFNGRVVDAQNNPVPFANVMNTRNQVGTYTDIRGNFNLIDSDSTLNIQVKSLGYETRNYTIIPKSPAQLVMEEDPTVKNSVAGNSNFRFRKLNAKQDVDSSEFEEPEPEVGWDHYDTYIANNINLSDDVKNTNAGREVQLSFQVDKFGQPTRIKITRSSKCKECDEAAIRVLKEGPKWTRNSKKSMMTLTIPVDK